MKKIMLSSLCILALSSVLLMTGFLSKKKDQIRHIVIFKYKPDAAPADIDKVTEAFKALQKKIPGIVSLEYGTNNSPENKNMGFTHVFQVTFEDAAARDAYLPHPEHKKFGELLGQLGVVEDVFVVDYMPM